MAQKIAMTVPMMRMAPGFCTRAQSSINGMLPRIAARPGKSTQMNGEIPEMNIGIIVRMKYRAKKMPVVMRSRPLSIFPVFRSTFCLASYPALPWVAVVLWADGVLWGRVVLWVAAVLWAAAVSTLPLGV